MMIARLGTVLALVAITACAVESESAARPHTKKAKATATYTKPADDVLKQQLTSLHYEVTQHAGTETPFKNAYWDNHDAGIYVDIVTGEPLFSSTNKFDSGTGWPSFYQPIESGHVVEIHDDTHGMDRTEVRSKAGASHLGHVFADGPDPTGL